MGRPRSRSSNTLGTTSLTASSSTPCEQKRDQENPIGRHRGKGMSMSSGFRACPSANSSTTSRARTAGIPKCCGSVEIPKCTKTLAESYINGLARSSKKPRSFFLALHASLCNAWQANAFRVPFWWRTAGVAHPAATWQGKTKSTCDVAQTDSPTQHTRCMTCRQRRSMFHTEESLIVGYIVLELAPMRCLWILALFTVLFECRVCGSVCLCVCLCECACGCLVCLYVWSKRNESECLEMCTCNRQ